MTVTVVATERFSTGSPQGTEGGGAALDQVIGLSVGGLDRRRALLWIGYLHRMRKITWLNDLGEWAGRKFKRPPWVALPIALFITTIISALFGFIWDVSLHIGKGRDPGPLANPAHYFILFGLFILFVAGCLAMRAAVRQARPVRRPHHPALVRPGRRPPDGRLRPLRADRLPARRRLAPHLRPGRHAVGPHPPDDDRRRRLLDADGAAPRARGPPGGRRGQPKDGPGIKFVQYLAFGGIVIGLSVFQIEFDFGVAQFRQVFEPMLIAAAGALRPGRRADHARPRRRDHRRARSRSGCAGSSRCSSGPCSARRSTGSRSISGPPSWSN